MWTHNSKYVLEDVLTIKHDVVSSRKDEKEITKQSGKLYHLYTKDFIIIILI